MADSRLEDLTEDTAPGADDLVYVVTNPGASSADRKVQITNLLAPDQDATISLGRAKISSPSSDEAFFSHYDRATTADYALKQTASGLTYVNAVAQGSLRISHVPICIWDNDEFRALPDTDATISLGRWKLGSVVSDYAYIAHFDHLSLTNYALAQTSSGKTNLNAPTGGYVANRINNVEISRFDVNGLQVLGDSDATTILGRAKIGSPASDIAYFAHYDNLSTVAYALRQTAAGNTVLNAKTGGTVSVTVNNSAVASWSATAFGTFDDTDATISLGRAKIGSPASDTLYFSHYDQNSTTNYALKQDAGATFTKLNAAVGGAVGLSLGNATQAYLSAAGNFLIGSTTDLGGKLQVEALNAVECRDSATDATAKSAAYSVTSYTNAEEPFVLALGTANSGSNTLFLGGGSASFNAATTIQFRAAAAVDTVTGTEMMRLTSTGLQIKSGAGNPSNIFEVDPDADATISLGRAKIGSPTSDEATFAHYDQLAAGTYALKQTAAGTATKVNVATGGTVSLAINNTDQIAVTAARSAFTAPAQLPSYAVASLPAGAAGDTAYASDGRKAGEGAGSGTGVLVFYDGSNWIAVDTGATVAA